MISRILRYLLFFLLLPVVVVQAQQAPASNAATYQPPVFKDDARVEKMKALFPAIEKMYKDYAQEKKFPGVAFGIVVNDRLVYTGNTGFTNLAKKTPVSSASLFRIASMSKSLTAMAILKLRDEGKLRLDDAASRYIPALKDVRLLTTDAPSITIRDLLTHSAGFPEDNPWGDRQLDITHGVFMAMLEKGISFSNVPGVAYEYSNMGFAMLGEIIAVVSGTSYQQYITRNILEPLGMTHTGWEYTKVPAALLAHGYRWLNGNWQEEELLHDGVYGAMGGLITSVEDFSRYMAFHLSAWPPRNDKETGPVKRSSVREMQQAWRFNNLYDQFTYPNGRACAMVNSYGYGLRISKDGEGRAYAGHSGGLPGFGSQWVIMPEYGIGVVVYGNLTYAGMSAINWAVLDTLVIGAKLMPRQLPVSPVLQQRKEALVKLLPDWNGAEESNIFAVNFFPDRSLAIRKKQAQDVFKKAGKIVNVTELVPENQLRGSFILQGEKAGIEIYFTLTPETPALIQQLDIKEVKKE
ncbi:serine hydrolase domain-containing protein [Agriterribacter sp.]|uniref:serine hydrolase domain-containing protein n=1 Tax=Agriterribacter sp. TaxID=2821509 RepID=UPI002C9470D3|nr:serine hydrolase domain-containing protein [Agriterribacter sp.]HRO47400.1 serine hydrolase domain-containing protein [Agriterribacter sp.]HRQ16598.1 serine hydrolase domain-containing protein [Agriterribacter sp.]